MENTIRQLIKCMLTKPEVKDIMCEELQKGGVFVSDDERIIAQDLQSKPSQLVISEDYRFILKDYGNREIDIKGNQAKVIYTLYLLLPHGVANNELINYRNIMAMIFELVANYKSEDKQRALEAIDNLLQRKGGIDDANHSINKAFGKVIKNKRTLQQYIILGERGKLRSIGLPKNLIKIKNQKLDLIKELNHI